MKIKRCKKCKGTGRIGTKTIRFAGITLQGGFAMCSHCFGKGTVNS